jgi:hypothetical protein
VTDREKPIINAEQQSPVLPRNVADLPDNSLLTVEEVAAWLRVEPAWVRAHASGNRRPEIPRLKLGRFLKFVKGDISQFLRQLKNQSQGSQC